jgi:hypothetical protein
LRNALYEGILGFIEYAFGLNALNPNGISGYKQFPYADYFAPDGPNNKNCNTCTYPLADFFNFNNGPSTFVPINSAKYPPSCFHNPKGSGCFGSNWQPSDPDNDAVDQQD